MISEMPRHTKSAWPRRRVTYVDIDGAGARYFFQVAAKIRMISSPDAS